MIVRVKKVGELDLLTFRDVAHYERLRYENGVPVTKLYFSDGGMKEIAFAKIVSVEESYEETGY